MIYFKHNEFRGAKMAFTSYDHSHLKSIRDDFNDMFTAEARMREKRGDMSLVFVLTYNDEHIHHFYGNNVLDADDLQRYSKASRFAKRLKKLGYEFDMISIGEYGNGGESHSYVGKRGKGQNPHFHCVGWFHKFRESAIDLDIEYLSLLVRREWQGCDTNDAVSYGRNKKDRKLGLGYVRLDGPIQLPESGSAYISKYMGKDMSERHTKKMYDKYVDSFHLIVAHLVSEAVQCSSDHIMALLSAWYRHVYDVEHRCPLDIRLLGTHIDKLLELCTSVFDDLDPLFLHTQDYWFEEITEHYLMFDDEFSSQWRNNHSPKLRKFHGFGHSLLDNCDEIAGTYQIVKDGGTVTRCLPPSLARKLYYDYHNYEAPYLTHSGRRKVVVYTPNSLGIRHFSFVAKHRMQKLRCLYLAKYENDPKFHIPSEILDDVIRIHVCVLPYDSLFTPRCCFLSDDEAAHYFGECHRSYLLDDEELLVDTRNWINTRSYIYQNRPSLVQSLMILDSIDGISRAQKNCKDKEFLDNWSRLYATEY